jgi:AbrB family looped-hinge helix DNA binding protein
MTDEVIILRISEDGRVTIPAKHRKAVGLEAGGVAVVRVHNGEICIRPVESVLAELQGKPRKPPTCPGDREGRLSEERRDAAQPYAW